MPSGRLAFPIMSIHTHYIALGRIENSGKSVSQELKTCLYQGELRNYINKGSPPLMWVFRDQTVEAETHQILTG